MTKKTLIKRRYLAGSLITPIAVLALFLAPAAFARFSGENVALREATVSPNDGGNAEGPARRAANGPRGPQLAPEPARVPVAPAGAGASSHVETSGEHEYRHVPFASMLLAENVGHDSFHDASTPSATDFSGGDSHRGGGSAWQPPVSAGRRLSPGARSAGAGALVASGPGASHWSLDAPEAAESTSGAMPGAPGVASDRVRPLGHRSDGPSPNGPVGDDGSSKDGSSKKGGAGGGPGHAGDSPWHGGDDASHPGDNGGPFGKDAWGDDSGSGDGPGFAPEGFTPLFSENDPKGDEPVPPSVPEPGLTLLMAAGAAAVARYRRRRPGA